MQLSTIKISNILSFPYVENLTTIDGVKFHNHENGVVNIMIGPNGSGKSNLLDIIHAVWKYGITINYSINNNDNKIPTITNTNNTQHNLTKHRGQENQKSHIYLSILLSQDDYNNILFLIKNQQIINTIIKKYSDISFQFSSINKEDFLNHSNKIPLYLNITKDNHIVLESNDDSVVSFIYQYFQNFELIQLCMEIYNTYEKKENSERYPLRNTFALITSETTISQTYTNKAIHLFCKKINSIQQQHGEKSIFEQFFIESLNNTLEQYTGFRLHNINQWSDSSFFVMNTDGTIFSYKEISSGEQSFLSLILLIYSHDLHNGFLIIDEPELHLHPQSQKQFLNLIEEMKTKQHIQYIIATHSPTMINEHNINHVFRCSKHNGKSIISCTQGNFGEDEATLLQMLKFDHIAKIFFVDTIILVEGETDMYFLSHLIEYLGSLPERSERISNYEIITISGKGGVRRRKQFLKKFNSNVFYIGDRDNTIEYNILSAEELSHLPHHRLQNNKGSKYAGIVEYIKKNNSDLYTRIIQGIQRLYKNNIFLLTQGDLESYTGMQSKGLDDTVNFCLHQFTTWIEDNHFQDKRKELFFIIESIFSQKG